MLHPTVVFSPSPWLTPYQVLDLLVGRLSNVLLTMVSSPFTPDESPPTAEIISTPYIYIRHLSIPNFQSTLSEGKAPSCSRRILGISVLTCLDSRTFPQWDWLINCALTPFTQSAAWMLSSDGQNGSRSMWVSLPYSPLHMFVHSEFVHSQTAELNQMLPCIRGHALAQHDGYNGTASVPCEI